MQHLLLNIQAGLVVMAVYGFCRVLPLLVRHFKSL